jgi:Tfp pilus assembly protein PilO
VLLRGALLFGILFITMGRIFSELPAWPAMLRVSVFALISLVLAILLGYFGYFNRSEKNIIRSAYSDLVVRRRLATAA